MTILNRILCFFKGHKWFPVSITTIHWCCIGKKQEPENSYSTYPRDVLLLRCDRCNKMHEKLLSSSYPSIAMEDLINV